MFFCEECRQKRNWNVPKAFTFSYGRCEICREVAECYVRPYSGLPDPDEKPKKPAPPPVEFEVTEEDWPTEETKESKRIKELEEEVQRLRAQLLEALTRADYNGLE